MTKDEFYSKTLTFDEVGEQVDIFKKEKEKYQQEIERLKNINEEHRILNGMIRKELQKKENIIKEVREYIEENTENIDRGRYYEDYVETYPILEILDKVGSDKE